jgi:hypothetical protein
MVGCDVKASQPSRRRPNTDNTPLIHHHLLSIDRSPLISLSVSLLGEGVTFHHETRRSIVASELLGGGLSSALERIIYMIRR